MDIAAEVKPLDREPTSMEIRLVRSPSFVSVNSQPIYSGGRQTRRKRARRRSRRQLRFPGVRQKHKLHRDRRSNVK